MFKRFKITSSQSLVIVILVLISFSSCRSHKDFMYLRDAEGKESIKGLPKPQPIYRIKKRDNLYISIVTANADLNKVYNPTQVGTNNSETKQFDVVAGQYLNGYEVDTNGNVSLPIIGNVNVEGKTLEESQRAIEVKAEAYIKPATIKVRLLNFRVTVLGEVKNPGVYNNYNYRFTVLEAIGMANGNTDYAALDNVLVMRPTVDGSQTYILNLNSKSALSSEGYYLQPNDVVVMQPASNKGSQIRVSTASLILAGVTSILLLLNYIKN